MIGTEEALELILSAPLELKTETVSLANAYGRVLAEDIHADRDFPPFNRVSMDGIAIRFSAYAKGLRSFEIMGMQAAGDPQKSLSDSEACLEVMTGAICPEGADTVIQYEHLQQAGNFFEALKEVRKGQNVHDKGLDRSAGELLIPAGTKIGHAEIGVCATVGKSQLSVLKTPKVVIYSTGEELVEIEENPLPHQIRKSNVFVLRSLLSELNIDPEIRHLADSRKSITDELKKALTDFDVIMMSGGVSKGKFDFIPEVLDHLGVEKLFHRVSQRPGKPLWFGKTDKTTVFGFPGNPVSTLVCFIKYAKPWLLKAYHQEEDKAYATLKEDVEFKPDLTYFLQVSLENLDSKLIATPKHGRGSGDLANLLQTDALLELPKGRNQYKKGEQFKYLRIR